MAFGANHGGALADRRLDAVAWLLLYETWVRRNWPPAALLGFWCGLGVYLDSMFVMTLGGIAVASLTALIGESFKGRGSVRDEVALKERRLWLTRPAHVLLVVAAFLAGAAPRAIGQRVEPYDAYQEQFTWNLDARLLVAHGRILMLDCLPRLVAGHRLPGLEADPDPALLGTGGPIQQSGTNPGTFRWWSLLLTTLALALFAAALMALGAVALKDGATGTRILATGLLALTLGVAAGFLINRNIFNSDNYRYLVLLLIPWAIGCGLVVQGAVRRGGPVRVNVVLLMLVLRRCSPAMPRRGIVAWAGSMSGWCRFTGRLMTPRSTGWKAIPKSVRSLAATGTFTGSRF